jgi:hypothetical protein
LPAAKWLDTVCAMQFFDTKRIRHGSLLGSNTLGSNTEASRNNRSRRG